MDEGNEYGAPPQMMPQAKENRPVENNQVSAIKERESQTQDFITISESDLEPTGYKGTGILQMKENNEVIVRSNERVYQTKDQKDARIQVHRGVDLIKELDKFGIGRPVVFMGELNIQGQDRVVTITERIHGKALDEITSADMTPDLQQALDRHFDSVAKYYESKFIQAQVGPIDYLADVSRPTQYMYGTTSGDPRQRIMLSDLDPLYITISREALDAPESTRWGGIYSEIAFLKKAISTFEEKANNGGSTPTRLESARTSLNHFIDNALTSTSVTRPEIKDYLERQRIA